MFEKSKAKAGASTKEGINFPAGIIRSHSLHGVESDGSRNTKRKRPAIKGGSNCKPKNSKKGATRHYGMVTASSSPAPSSASASASASVAHKGHVRASRLYLTPSQTPVPGTQDRLRGGKLPCGLPIPQHPQNSLSKYGFLRHPLCLSIHRCLRVWLCYCYCCCCC
jgi:hypothetical protein